MLPLNCKGDERENVEEEEDGDDDDERKRYLVVACIEFDEGEAIRTRDSWKCSCELEKKKKRETMSVEK